jgi:hypothetical protein
MENTTKKTIGRPPKTKDQKRTITYRFRLTPIEHKALITSANNVDLTASDYIRNVLGSYTSLTV